MVKVTLIENCDIVDLCATKWSRFVMCQPRRYVELDQVMNEKRFIICSFCNVYYGVSGPSLIIESTDSMAGQHA